MITQLDQLLTHLGTGSWSILHFTALCYCTFLAAPHTLGGAFIGPRIDFRCRPLEEDLPLHMHDPALHLNLPTSNSSTPILFPQDECNYLVNQTSVRCTDWDFDNSTFTSTITSEFGLVCEREYLRATYQSIYMLGVFIGAPLSAVLADRYGRKRMLTVGGMLYVIIAMASCWLPGLTEILASRLLLGIFHPVLITSSLILAVEVAEPRYRTVMGFGIYLLWAVGTMVWGGTAYLIRQWRLLHLAVSVPGLVLLPALWFIDESPRWLMVRGRHDEALKVLRRAARWNRVALPPQEELLHFMAEEVPPTKKTSPGSSTLGSVLQSWLHEVAVLFLTPKLRLITIILYIDYMVVSMVYYGLSLSGGSLSDDPFVYMTLMGLMEVPAYTLTIPIVDRVGRRALSVASFIFSGAMLMILAVIPAGYTGLVVGTALAGKVTITVAFQAVIFYSSELFPTEVRSRGLGTSLMMSRIGSICSSYIVDFVGSWYPWAPSVMFGVASLLVGLASLRLPETLGAVLSETIAHLEGKPDKTSSKISWRKLLKIKSTSGP